MSQDIDAAGTHEVRTFMLNSHWPEFPYPGLRPFSVTNSADESLIFYGRNAHKDDVIRRLNIGHTVFVLGPSGCGKSSLIKAGVIPALEAGLLTRAGHRWRSAEMRPGSRPLTALAKAITSLLPETNEQLVAEVERLLGSEPSGLWLAFDFVRSSIGVDTEDRCVLLLLDQFEEVFGRQIVDGKEVDQLMRLITRFFLKPHPKLFLTVTMRSEFVGDCANFPRLAEVINASQYLTPVLTPGELRQAIERPATEYGGVVDSDLVQQIIADMGSGTSYESDHLPLMQHALLWLWQRAWRRAGLERPPRPDRDPPPQPIRLTREDYVSHGGFKGILDRHADDILASVTVDPEGERRKIAKVMFQRISLRDDQLRYRRSPATVEEICQLASCAPAELYTVTQPFTEPEASLIEMRPSEATGDKLVDVRHETLIRQWSTLRRWADEEFDSAQRYKQVEDAAKLWHEGRGSLWTKRQLADALAWRKSQDPKPAWAARYARSGPGDPFQLAMDFIRKSALHRLKRRGLITVAISLPVILVAGAFLLAIYASTYILAALPYQNPADELTDFGVQQQRTLKQADLATSTPTGVPGGRVIDTLGLKIAMNSGLIQGARFILIDALFEPGQTHRTIPKSVPIPYAGLRGDFQDDLTRKLGDELKKQTGNDPDMPLVFFCLGPHCWESYNACLRAIHLGYTRVYWYRGGIDAWFKLRSYNAKDLDLTRIEVKLADTPEIVGVVIRIIGRIFKLALLGDRDQTVPLDAVIAHASNNRGLDHSDHGDYDYAIQDYDQAIKLDPTNAHFYYNRGNAYSKKLQYDRAIGDYDEAVKFDTKYFVAYIDRGNAKLKKGDHDRAIQDYDEAIKLNPESADAYSGRAHAHYYKGVYDRAIQDYGEAIKLDPKRVMSYYDRGNVYFVQGDDYRAIQDFNQLIQLRPDNPVPYQSRALAELYWDMADAAVSDLVKAVELRSSDQYSVIWLHIARTRAGQNDVREFASSAEKLNRAEWPWPIVDLFLGTSNPEIMRAATHDANSPDTSRDRVCEADFFFGIYQQEKGAGDEARRLFDSATKTCPQDYVEYRAAKRELERQR